MTIFTGVALSTLLAPGIGAAASSLGQLIMWATDLQPFLMGIIVEAGVQGVMMLNGFCFRC